MSAVRCVLFRARLQHVTLEFLRSMRHLILGMESWCGAVLIIRWDKIYRHSSNSFESSHQEFQTNIQVLSMRFRRNIMYPTQTYNWFLAVLIAAPQTSDFVNFRKIRSLGWSIKYYIIICTFNPPVGTKNRFGTLCPKYCIPQWGKLTYFEACEAQHFWSRKSPSFGISPTYRLTDDAICM